MSARLQHYAQSYARIVEQLARPRHRIGLNVFRVLAGCLMLLQYLLNYRERFYLFGPNGVVSAELAAAERQVFSVYQFSSDARVFDLLFHAGIVVTFAWLIGFKTRLLTPIAYLFWLSLRSTNRFLWDGGDNLLQLVMIYACFADLSPLRRQAEPSGDGARPSIPAAIAGLLHNGALLAFALQVCFLYGVAGLTKVQGEAWQNGTALYYALWPAQFRFVGVSELLLEDAGLLALATHATVFSQVAFPFLFCLNRHTRHLAVLMATAFHVGIAAVMGLFTFAGFMIATDLALIDDAAYRRASRALRGAWARLRQLRSGRSAAPADAAGLLRGQLP